MRVRTDGEHTRKIILDAACSVFGEKGFHKATHAEICRLAGVNTAAINYHFHNKENLYRLAFEHSIELAEKLYPIDKGVEPSDPPEKRLRTFIWALVSRRKDQVHLGYFHNMRIMEQIFPTGMIVDPMKKMIERNRNHAFEIIREILGHDATKAKVDLCFRSIISQCLFPGHMPPNPKMKAALKPPVFDTESIVDHVTKFSLAGIRAVKNDHDPLKGKKS